MKVLTKIHDSPEAAAAATGLPVVPISGTAVSLGVEADWHTNCAGFGTTGISGFGTSRWLLAYATESGKHAGAEGWLVAHELVADAQTGRTMVVAGPLGDAEDDELLTQASKWSFWGNTVNLEALVDWLRTA